MYLNIKDKIQKLPDYTHIFFGHEYAVDNLRFAKALDPRNLLIQKMYKKVKQN